MICDKYDSLSHYDKVQFMGKLCHAAQTDDVLFTMAQELIKLGEQRGLFDKVAFPTDERRDLQSYHAFDYNLSPKEEILKRWKDAPIVGEPKKESE